MRKFYTIIVCVILLLTVNSAYSQKSEYEVKVSFIYRFANNIIWENINEADTFFVGYLGSNPSFLKKYKLLEERPIHGIPVKVYSYNFINRINYSKLHLIYIDNEQNWDHEALFTAIQGKEILLVSDREKQQELVMINFVLSEDNKFSFEVNTKTIAEQGLEIDPQLLLLGGKEIDIRKLYKLQEQELDKERKQVRMQKEEIEILGEEIKTKEIELKKKEIEIENQIQLLSKQRAVLDSIREQVSENQSLLRDKVRQLKIKETEIEEQQKLIEEQNIRVASAREELQVLNEMIEKRQKELKAKQEEIEKKQKELSLKDSTIDLQKQWIIIGSVVLGIILVLAILLVKMIIERIKANRKLEHKNILINNKNVEINSQKEEILTQKDYIESQYKETQASINYAQTIQSAILPEHNKISSVFKTMLLFRPKDIVSGDFYWSCHLPMRNGKSEKFFFAAVDCTGHGVPGAFMSLIGNRLLKEIVNEKKITNPAEILGELDKSIAHLLKQNITSNRDGMDLCLCRIENTETGQFKIRFSGAKRPLYLYNAADKTLNRYKGTRKSIGGSVFRKSFSDNFEEQEITAAKGDILYLSTDGYIDQNDKERSRFGSKRFAHILKEIATENFSYQKKILDKELDKHMANTEQRDDITVLAVKL